MCHCVKFCSGTISNECSLVAGARKWRGGLQAGEQDGILPIKRNEAGAFLSILIISRRIEKKTFQSNVLEVGMDRGHRSCPVSCLHSNGGFK